MKHHWQKLGVNAWMVQKHSNGKTKVGCAILSHGHIFIGCNIEHKFRCHDIHAEVNAIGNMISQGYDKIEKILIVAERQLFLPCGGCLDWIFEFGGSECEIGFQGPSNSSGIVVYKANELMPYYPK